MVWFVLNLNFDGLACPPMFLLTYDVHFMTVFDMFLQLCQIGHNFDERCNGILQNIMCKMNVSNFIATPFHSHVLFLLLITNINFCIASIIKIYL